MPTTSSRAARAAAVLVLVTVWSLGAGCAAHRIAGTQIPDNDDTRAIVAVIDAYRQAAERRDAAGVLAVASSRYFDDAGTPDPGDDLDRGGLERRLGEDYARITAMRLDIAVRRIEVEGERASAFVFYDAYYRITTKGGEIAKQASDLHRMRLVKEKGSWKLASGL